MQSPVRTGNTDVDASSASIGARSKVQSQELPESNSLLKLLPAPISSIRSPKSSGKHVQCPKTLEQSQKFDQSSLQTGGKNAGQQAQATEMDSAWLDSASDQLGLSKSQHTAGATDMVVPKLISKDSVDLEFGGVWFDSPGATATQGCDSPDWWGAGDSLSSDIGRSPPFIGFISPPLPDMSMAALSDKNSSSFLRANCAVNTLHSPEELPDIHFFDSINSSHFSDRDSQGMTFSDRGSQGMTFSDHDSTKTTIAVTPCQSRSFYEREELTLDLGDHSDSLESSDSSLDLLADPPPRMDTLTLDRENAYLDQRTVTPRQFRNPEFISLVFEENEFHTCGFADDNEQFLDEDELMEFENMLAGQPYTDFLEYPENTEQLRLFRCTICDEVLQNPRVLVPCGCECCKECFDTWKAEYPRDNVPCPQCKRILYKATCTPAQRTMTYLNNHIFNAHCIFHGDGGCNERIPIWKFRSHIIECFQLRREQRPSRLLTQSETEKRKSLGFLSHNAAGGKAGLLDIDPG